MFRRTHLAAVLAVAAALTAAVSGDDPQELPLQRPQSILSVPPNGYTSAESVAIDGDHAVIVSDNPTRLLAYSRTESGWVLQQELADPLEPSAICAPPLALSGDVLVAGVYFASVGGDYYQGQVHVFERGPRGWQRVTTLFDHSGGPEDFFGYSVATDGTRIVVGAVGHRGPGGFFSGAVYVYERNVSGAWTQTAKLQTPTTDNGDGLGRTVAIAGDRIAATANFADNGIPGHESGTAWVYRLVDAEWQVEAKLPSPVNEPMGRFGTRLAFSGDRLAVGVCARRDYDECPPQAVVYARDQDDWRQQTTIPAEAYWPSSPIGYDLHVALVGDSLALVAWPSRSAVVFAEVDGTWRPARRVEAPWALGAATPAFGGRRLVLPGYGAFRSQYFVFDFPPPGHPLVSHLTPEVVPPEGGTPVTVHGDSFADGAVLRIAREPVPDVTRLDSTRLAFVTPPAAPGRLDVEVMNPDASRGTKLDGLSYGVVDLKAERITMLKPLASGATFWGRTEYRNLGRHASVPTDVQLVLSNDAVLDHGDTVLSRGDLPPTAGGATGEASFELRLPPGLASGTYYLFATLDLAGIHAEGDEANNVVGTSVVVGCDLTTRFDVTPRTVRPGRLLRTTGFVRNLGPGHAWGAGVRVVLSQDAVLDAADRVILSWWGEMWKPGGRTSLQWYYTVPPDLAPGTYYVIAMADPDNKITERTEANNITTVPITVRPRR